MISNSNRLSTQLFFEKLLGCDDPSDIRSFQGAATELQLGVRESRIFKDSCNTDCLGFLFKGTLSLLSGISELHLGRRTWPVVQLYYATYYFLRAELLMRGRCILRANQVFTVLSQNGERVEKVSNKNSKSDHTLTTLFAKKYLDGSDVLLSQSIGGDLPYDWLRKHREWYQYKQANYIEGGDSNPFFPFETMGLLEQIVMFLRDSDPYFCFDADYALLALPVKRFQLSISNAKERNIVLPPNLLERLRPIGTSNNSCAELYRLLSR